MRAAGSAAAITPVVAFALRVQHRLLSGTETVKLDIGCSAADAPNGAGAMRGMNEGAAKVMREPRPKQSGSELSHNLQGQRLGHKGRKTRERVLTAALRLLESPSHGPLTLSTVAREASVGMTTLYLYFPDIGDLLIAALDQVMALAGREFGYYLRARWPDENLQASCLKFLTAHYQFWRRNSRILHMCNRFADDGDARFVQYRHQVSQPLIDLLIVQMDSQTAEHHAKSVHFATLLLAGFERVATLGTSPIYLRSTGEITQDDEKQYVDEMMNAEADLAALIISHQRELRPKKYAG